MTGRIRAGAMLSQADLVEIVGVPVGPLREAVQVLEAEGLLTVMPRSGIRILKPDLALIRNAFQLRRLLEREAAAHFATHATGGLLEHQRAVHQALLDESLVSPRHPTLWARARAMDSELHRMLIGSLRNPLISSTFERVHCQITLVQLDMEYELSPTLIHLMMQEHLAIITALRSGDGHASDAGDAPAYVALMGEGAAPD